MMGKTAVVGLGYVGRVFGLFAPMKSCLPAKPRIA